MAESVDDKLRRKRAGGQPGKKAAAGTPPPPEWEKDGLPPEPPEWRFTLDGEKIAEGEAVDILDAAEGRDKEKDGGGPKRQTREFHIRTLGNLLATDFPAPRWLIEGIMSEGLNLLIGSPKMGKSIMALNLALTIAGGGKALDDIPVSTASVLYLSLEDKDRRVKDRALKMLTKLPVRAAESAAKRLSVVTTWPRQDEGGLAAIEMWRKRAEDPGLVIIDVWNRFQPVKTHGASAYTQDADAVGEVKAYCDKHTIAGLIVHHDRKVQGGGKAEEDFVASISGTQGIAGGADGIMVLVRSRNEVTAELKITGRDVEERALTVEFDKESLTWRSLGASDKVMTGKVQLQIIEYLKKRDRNGATAPDIADGIKANKDSVRVILNRMLTDKAITKRGNIWYWPFEDEDEVA